MTSSPNAPGLRHLPLPLFAAPMGVGGLGLAWREAGVVLGAPAAVGESLLAIATALWVGLLALHGARALRWPEALKGDLAHPIRAAFAGAVTIGLMIVAAAVAPYAPGAAQDIWWVAVVGHLAIGVLTVRELLTAPREAATLTPPLLIPLVGNVFAPILGAKLGHVGLSWGLFGIGFLLWALIQPLIMGRLATGPALPERLRPSLAILLAPPAVGCVALVNLTGAFGPAPAMAYGLASFVYVVILGVAPKVLAGPFAVSWWAWTFPSAAFAVATLLAAHAFASALWIALGWITLLASTAIVALVAARTIAAAQAGELLRPEG